MELLFIESCIYCGRGSFLVAEIDTLWDAVNLGEMNFVSGESVPHYIIHTNECPG